jgi:hypothetical protein
MELLIESLGGGRKLVGGGRGWFLGFSLASRTIACCEKMFTLANLEDVIRKVGR